MIIKKLTYYGNDAYSTGHIEVRELTAHSLTVVHTRIIKASIRYCQCTAVNINCFFNFNLSTTDHSAIQVPYYGWPGEALGTTAQHECSINHNLLTGFWIFSKVWAYC